ncbi:MAG TPA: DUF2520 domain-containing protein [Acidimicrobiales bacterium]|nr:DUF2520 domain-containing protein [Acidimicrobiales bacterium]
MLPRPGVVRIVGPGRAGGALARALAGAGWTVAPPVRHGDDPATATDGVELVVVATPDAAIADVAAAVAPRDGVVVAHLSGSLGTGVLAPHAHRVALHPLASLPDAEVGAERLQGAWFAVTASTARASAVAGAVVDALGGRLLAVADEDRVAHHAAASIAANHLVALLAQVERIAPDGVPLHAYLDMVRATVDNVARLGPAAALTGPAARGDTATIERHLAAIPADERPAYLALSARAARLAADAREASGG